MVALSTNIVTRDKYQLQGHKLKAEILRHFYDASTGIYHLDKNLPIGGICQDVKAHAVTLGLLPNHVDDLEHLTDPGSALPRAFRGLGHWDVSNVSSPYATGFAVEALLSRDRGTEAVKLIERVWGPMADTASPNYSGGHWEAMMPDGTPHGHDTSLMHGWSTWPVSLMPRYLAGLHPIEPGWKSFCVAPVLAGLKEVKCTMETVVGAVGMELEVDEANGQGSLKVLAPYGVHAQLQSPLGWIIHGPQSIEGTGIWQKFFLSEASGDQDLISKDKLHEAVDLHESDTSPTERQIHDWPNRIRSLLSRFTAIRA